MLLATVLGSSMAMLDSTVVNLALPRMGADLEASPALAQTGGLHDRIATDLDRAQLRHRHGFVRLERVRHAPLESCIGRVAVLAERRDDRLLAFLDDEDLAERRFGDTVFRHASSLQRVSDTHWRTLWRFETLYRDSAVEVTEQDFVWEPLQPDELRGLAVEASLTVEHCFAGPDGAAFVPNESPVMLIVARKPA